MPSPLFADPSGLNSLDSNNNDSPLAQVTQHYLPFLPSSLTTRFGHFGNKFLYDISRPVNNVNNAIDPLRHLFKPVAKAEDWVQHKPMDTAAIAAALYGGGEGALGAFGGGGSAAGGGSGAATAGGTGPTMFGFTPSGASAPASGGANMFGFTPSTSGGVNPALYKMGGQMLMGLGHQNQGQGRGMLQAAPAGPSGFLGMDLSQPATPYGPYGPNGYRPPGAY